MKAVEVWLFAQGAPLASSGRLSLVQSEHALGFALDRLSQLGRLERVPAVVVAIDWDGPLATGARLHRNGLSLSHPTRAVLEAKLRAIGLSPEGKSLSKRSKEKSGRRLRGTRATGFWMFGDDGSELYLNAENQLEDAAHRDSTARYFAETLRKGIAAVIAILEWTGPLGSKPDRAVVRKTKDRLPARLEEKLAQGMEKYGLDPEGNPLPNRQYRGSKGNRPATSRQKAAKKITVEDVLNKIKKRRDLAPCDTRFARELRVAASPSFLRTCSPSDLEKALRRFVRCDWGDVDRRETANNNRITRSGKPGEGLFAIYRARNGASFFLFGSPTTHKAYAVMPHEIEDFGRFG